MNQTIQERVRCILSHAKLPKSFWGEAVKITVDIINLLPSVPLEGVILKEVWSKKKASYNHVRCLVVEHSSTFLRMNEPSLTQRQRNSFTLDLQEMNLDTDYGNPTNTKMES